jgi:hypothetical protein
MKTTTLLICIVSLIACGKGPGSSVTMITDPTQQETLFQNLITVTKNSIPEISIGDSLSFLVLPVQASCPSCRKKTIDSIMKHQANLADRHYIIIAANGGRKTIRGYFREQAYEMPDIKNYLFLDSNNLANKNNLYKDNPTLYYSHGKKVYKKVAAIPATVREDLCEFFSGHRELK